MAGSISPAPKPPSCKVTARASATALLALLPVDLTKIVENGVIVKIIFVC